MGYNLTIGEWQPPTPDEILEGQTYGSVNVIEQPNAPAFNEPTDFSNTRWPSYSGWADFLTATNLGWLSPRTSRDFREDPDIAPLMPSHPGVARITPEHLNALEIAYEAYRDKIGRHCLPGWLEGGLPGSPQSSSYWNATTQKVEPIPEGAEMDGNLARFEWLLYWVRWSLENCKTPVFHNT